jgi:hypothetical protein
MLGSKPMIENPIPKSSTGWNARLNSCLYPSEASSAASAFCGGAALAGACRSSDIVIQRRFGEGPSNAGSWSGSMTESSYPSPEGANGPWARTPRRRACTRAAEKKKPFAILRQRRAR